MRSCWVGVDSGNRSIYNSGISRARLRDRPRPCAIDADCDPCFSYFQSSSDRTIRYLPPGFGCNRRGIVEPTTKTVAHSHHGDGLVYLFANNYFLVRFFSPVYPGYAEFELSLGQIEPIRLALLFASGAVFTCLNIDYLFSIMKANWRPISARSRSLALKMGVLNDVSVSLRVVSQEAVREGDRLIRSRLKTELEICTVGKPEHDCQTRIDLYPTANIRVRGAKHGNCGGFKSHSWSQFTGTHK